MSSDRCTNPREPGWRDVGTGMALTTECWTCKKPRQLAGGKRVGLAKLFKCSYCLAEKKRAEAKC